MRILYLASVRIPSEKASGLAIVRQCQAFVDIGNSVDLLVPKRDSIKSMTIEEMYGIKPKFSVIEIGSFSVYYLGKMGFYTMMILEAFKMFFYYRKKEVEYDLIYSRDQRLLIPFVLAGYSHKCFLELHTKYTDFITKLVSNRVKKLIVISQGLKDYYSGVLGRSDIQVEPSGVDLEQFKNLPEPTTIKRSLSLPLDKTIFGYVGKYQTMGESKGVDEIIQAFAEAYKKNSNIHLLLVGIEESEKEVVLNIVSDLALPDDTCTIMELDQSRFAEYLVASDVLLMNYPDTEHYAEYMSPTKLFAYLAVGRPIISSDLPTLRSIVGDDEVVFVKAGSKEMYSEAILYVVDNIISLIKPKESRIKLVTQFEWHNRSKRILCSNEATKSYE